MTPPTPEDERRSERANELMARLQIFTRTQVIKEQLQGIQSLAYPGLTPHIASIAVHLAILIDNLGRPPTAETLEDQPRKEGNLN